MNLAPKNTAENLDAELLPLAKPIRRSDVLTLHVLANEHCRSILGKRRLRRRKKRAFPTRWMLPCTANHLPWILT